MTAYTMAVAEQRGPRTGGSVIRVLLVDDHVLLRQLLADVLGETDDIAVVGECADGDEVVDVASRTHPDVVLMDASMVRTDGLEATRRLLDVQPQARVVILTGSFSEDSRREAEDIGAVGYLLKGDVFSLPERIRSVASGGTAWS
jgi:DNA-binding NarL/FixJ family response regulator